MNPVVGIIMGSDSDLPTMQEASKILKQFEIPYEIGVYSAHRSPHRTAEYVRSAHDRGLKVIIAGAGSSAHLAGVTAAETTLPVIGVPIDSSPLSGFDALLSTVQMPPGVPVATMGVGKSGATNAAIFAVQILAVSDRASRREAGRIQSRPRKSGGRKKQESPGIVMKRPKHRDCSVTPHQMPNTFHITNFGCRASQSEGASIQQELLEANAAEAASPYEAEVVIINSCTVTAEADRDVRQTIRRIASRNPRVQNHRDRLLRPARARGIGRAAASPIRCREFP